VSNAQGVGSGRRGDGADGHNWAGGLGALLDVDGNDTFRAGNFSQGLGYWYGTGLLWDGGGNDEYVSVYFTQGSGAHFAIGALIDEGGNDKHTLKENAGAAFGFGWDVVNALRRRRAQGVHRAATHGDLPIPSLAGRHLPGPGRKGLLSAALEIGRPQGR
jgi:hypothetical protein